MGEEEMWGVIGDGVIWGVIGGDDVVVNEVLRLKIALAILRATE